MRVSVFIDGNNFYYSLRRIYGNNLSNFNFGKFCDFLTSGDELVNIFYYNAELDKERNFEKYKSQQKFFERLRKIPRLNLILCNLVRRRLKSEYYYVLKEDDIHLAVDLVLGACDDKYDRAVLVSGDGDFVPAVLAVRGKGRIILNACFNKNTSVKLKKICNELVKLNKGILDRFFI
jgi:uncharacterized LabA/DUF88 family protein